MKPLAPDASWASYSDLFSDQSPKKSNLQEYFDFDFDTEPAAPKAAPAADDRDAEARWIDGEISLDELEEIQTVQADAETNIDSLDNSSSVDAAALHPALDADNQPISLSSNVMIHPGSCLPLFSQNILWFPPHAPGGLPFAYCGPLVPLSQGDSLEPNTTFAASNSIEPSDAAVLSTNFGPPSYWTAPHLEAWNSGVSNDHSEDAQCDSDLGDDSEEDEDEDVSTIDSDADSSGSGSTLVTNMATGEEDEEMPISSTTAHKHESRGWAYAHCALDPNDWVLQCPICVQGAQENECPEECFFSRQDYAAHIAEIHIHPVVNDTRVWKCPLIYKNSRGLVQKCHGRVSLRTNAAETGWNRDSIWKIVRHIGLSQSHHSLIFGFPIQRAGDGTWVKKGDSGLMPDLQCKYCPETFSPLWARDGKLARHIEEEHSD